MAKANSSGSKLNKKTSTKRPGIHSKCKSSVSKNAKNYTKKYKGQGK